jgi:hypothetical protein
MGAGAGAGDHGDRSGTEPASPLAVPELAVWDGQCDQEAQCSWDIM